MAGMTNDALRGVLGLRGSAVPEMRVPILGSGGSLADAGVPINFATMGLTLALVGRHEKQMPREEEGTNTFGEVSVMK